MTSSDITVLEEGEIIDSQWSSDPGQPEDNGVNASRAVHYQEIFEILYYRYGFVLNKSRSTGDEDANETIYNPAIQKQWQLLTKIIASNAAVIPDVTEPIFLAFGFLAAFSDKGYVPNPEIQNTWDMNAQSACPLREVMDRSLLIITRDGEGDNGDVVLYTISSKSDIATRSGGGIKWTLAIQDPIAVLDTVRRNLGPDIENVVNFLVHSGIPFNTIVASNTYPPPPRLRLSPPVGLGKRLRSWSPDPEDYRDYEEARDDFLRGPFGRAALLRGGIIWRLSKEIVPIYEVFDGPTQMAKEFGQVVLTTGGDDMIDDNLSDEQLGLISGLYHISHGHNVKQVSWWPKHATWEGCGLDVGYWSSSCETWFQNRLRGIRNGTANPRTAREWKNALSYQKQTPIVMDNVRKAADAFLSVYFDHSV